MSVMQKDTASDSKSGELWEKHCRYFSIVLLMSSDQSEYREQGILPSYSK